MEVLNIVNCEKLKSFLKLSVIPEEMSAIPEEIPVSIGLKQLVVDNCPSLTLLDLPAGLKQLVIGNCRDLTQLLPTLPTRLKNLNLTKCLSLQQTPELKSRLTELENNGCFVAYPRNFGKV